MSDDALNPGAESDRPERFGPYRVEDRIGAGGMGVVYLALDEDLQRLVALKTLLPALAADPEFVARFKREAQSAAALNHPNITQIYSIGQAAKGLRHAAQKKLIHRDVKPSNLMLAEDGVVKITDFGLAKAAKSDTQLTATGEIL